MTKRGGFTLVEVIASLVLASVTLVSILNLIMMNARLSHANMRRVKAYNLLQRKLEELKLEDFSTLANENNTNFTSDPGYSFDVVITPINAALKQLDVSISWNSLSSGNVSESITVLRAFY